MHQPIKVPQSWRVTLPDRLWQCKSALCLYQVWLTSGGLMCALLSISASARRRRVTQLMQGGRQREISRGGVMGADHFHASRRLLLEWSIIPPTMLTNGNKDTLCVCLSALQLWIYISGRRSVHVCKLQLWVQFAWRNHHSGIKDKIISVFICRCFDSGILSLCPFFCTLYWL